MGREVVSAVRRRRLNPEFDAPAGTNAAAAPPVKMPIQPSEATASRTPLASVWPKPVRGTVAPAPPHWARGSYSPRALSSTPTTTYPVRMRAGVS